MKLLLYGICLAIFGILTDVSSSSTLEGVIYPILTVVFFFLFVVKLLTVLNISGVRGDGGGGGGFGGGFGGGDSCGGGDGGGC